MSIDGCPGLMDGMTRPYDSLRFQALELWL